jgi:hypothetical protein
LLHPDSLRQVVHGIRDLVHKELARQRKKLRAKGQQDVSRPRESSLERYAKRREFAAELGQAKTASERAALYARERCLAARSQGKRADYRREYEKALAERR